MLAGDTGDAKHDWVVDKLVQFISLAVPIWVRPFVKSGWFRKFLDGIVFDAFQAMRKLGKV